MIPKAMTAIQNGCYAIEDISNAFIMTKFGFRFR